jgi:hypothetical protein
MQGLALQIAPYGVIVKPSHAAKILRNQPQGGFSPKAGYIFRKQLEEADFLIINRTDELAAAEADALEQLVLEQYPGRRIVRMSAKTGEGFAGLCELLDTSRSTDGRVVDLDYNAYAEGEAELGWLNCRLRLTADSPFGLDALLEDVLRRAQHKFSAYRAEVAHLKIIGLCEGSHAIANLVANSSDVELSRASSVLAREADVVVNARVAADPLLLSGIIRGALAETCQARQVRPEFGPTRSFQPARPRG